jgi:hypothetical protein
LLPRFFCCAKFNGCAAKDARLKKQPFNLRNHLIWLRTLEEVGPKRSQKGAFSNERQRQIK